MTLAVGAAALMSCSAVPAAPLDLRDFTLTFDESFKTLDISSNGPGTRWIAHTPWHGDFGDAVFDNPGPDGPFSLSADALTITARKDAAGRWHSGLICSMDRDGAGQQGFAQQYGYFEMKAKLPGTPGVWPAFWLIGTDKTTSSAEIDVLEYYGISDKYYHSVEHVWVGGKDRLHLDHMHEVPPGSLSRQFNTFGILIGPLETSFYFNREPIWTTPTPPEYRQPMYILANLALGGGWPIKDVVSPTEMQIAYIRAYQSKTASAPRTDQ